MEGTEYGVQQQASVSGMLTRLTLLVCQSVGLPVVTESKQVCTVRSKEHHTQQMLIFCHIRSLHYIHDSQVNLLITLHLRNRGIFSKHRTLFVVIILSILQEIMQPRIEYENKFSLWRVGKCMSQSCNYTVSITYVTGTKRPVREMSILLGKIWKEAVKAYFKTLLRNLESYRVYNGRNNPNTFHVSYVSRLENFVRRLLS